LAVTAAFKTVIIGINRITVEGDPSFTKTGPNTLIIGFTSVGVDLTAISMDLTVLLINAEFNIYPIITVITTNSLFIRKALNVINTVNDPLFITDILITDIIFNIIQELSIYIGENYVPKLNIPPNNPKPKISEVYLIFGIKKPINMVKKVIKKGVYIYIKFPSFVKRFRNLISSFINIWND
jgi:hypothetical protein